MVRTFPTLRLRRLRKTDTLRRFVRETELSVGDFIYPIFVTPGHDQRRDVESMPGIAQVSLDLAVREAEDAASLGIPAIVLFGIPEKKDEVGSEAYAWDGVIQKAIRLIKKELPELLVITDVCLCEYTSHGHCGIIVDGYVDNDKSLELLSRTALTHAEAGADMVAPSNMMDGCVAAIRRTLDEEGFQLTPIMSYAAKYASCFYGPFREAAQSAPSFGDRRSYQMDPPNVREALLEMKLDLEEGADIVMVKPALAYLDVIARAREAFDCPIAAYNVSGEYAMVKAAGRNGWLDEKRATLEILTSIKRAGAGAILSYHAKEVARWLREQQQGG
ncbi:MAG: porphobilinogen synthase [Chloroflexi bacterium]|nr:porphobilinogen synthase [Chloroflexota bacterium]